MEQLFNVQIILAELHWEQSLLLLCLYEFMNATFHVTSVW